MICHVKCGFTDIYTILIMKTFEKLHVTCSTCIPLNQGANPVLRKNYLSISYPFVLNTGSNEVLLQFTPVLTVIRLSREGFEATCLFLKKTKAT